MYTRIFSETGTVADGCCTCVAGKGGTCSHVAALLFFLASVVERKLQKIPADVSCTGRPCSWSKAPKRDFSPATVSDISFKKAEFGKTEKAPGRSLDDFEPRQEGDQHLVVDDRASLFAKLQKCAPSSGVLFFHDQVPLQASMPDYDGHASRELILLDEKSCRQRVLRS